MKVISAAEACPEPLSFFESIEPGCSYHVGDVISQSISTHYFFFRERVPPQRENQLDYLLSTYVCVCYFSSALKKRELIHMLPNPPFFFLKMPLFLIFFVTI